MRSATTIDALAKRNTPTVIDKKLTIYFSKFDAGCIRNSIRISLVCMLLNMYLAATYITTVAIKMLIPASESRW